MIPTTTPSTSDVTSTLPRWVWEETSFMVSFAADDDLRRLHRPRVGLGPEDGARTIPLKLDELGVGDHRRGVGQKRVVAGRALIHRELEYVAAGQERVRRAVLGAGQSFALR